MKNLIGLKTKCSADLGSELVERNSWLGLVVQSLCGHDASRFYLVIGEDMERLYLVDGQYRSVDYPKTKSWHHVVMVGEALNIEQLSELRSGCNTVGEVNAKIRSLIQSVVKGVDFG